ncbi:MAG: hypothetical protein LBC61_07930 [Candidatus Peribacteria bacterium]|jgi:hypothetical protein|nr:hypothetical protein [Candidatus Peribacteria bacterium]
MKKGGKKIDLTKFKDFTKRTITALMTKPPKPNAIQTSTLQQVGQALTTK